jgi:aryl-alcohol dehydrogenase-like predicted oxidoreductase
MTTGPDAAASGTFVIGSELPVHRLGFGAMRLTGEGIWGEPDDADQCAEVLRRAVSLGVTLIDTADSYGPAVSERLIGETLAPYRDDLVIATKAGLERPGPGEWSRNGRPEHLRSACEDSLRRLRLETIDLYQLHRIDRNVPAEEQIGTMTELRDEGKIRHIGLSEVTVDQLRWAQAMTPIATVQNSYNLTHRDWEEVLDVCAAEGIGFIPFFPLAVGELAGSGGAVAEIAEGHDATPAQIALAWLLGHAEVMLPIPGTSSVEHLEENVGAAGVELTDAERQRLDDSTERPVTGSGR